MRRGLSFFAWILAIGFGVVAVTTMAFAHALQPGYLEVRQIDDDLYAALWKVPVVGGAPMDIQAELPGNCDTREAGQPVWDGTAYVARWTTPCPGGLANGMLSIRGLEKTSTDVLVRFDFADEVSQSYRLTPTETSYKIPAQPGKFDVVKTYLLLGIEHILSGIDHLVFVLALVILVRGARRLVATITAFTVAHSITLAGATLGLVNLPAAPVEAAIALSIVFVAAEIVHAKRGNPSVTGRYPWIVAFSFGLLHGFGFAGALSEIGLPQSSIPLALLFFNVGVEIGQLLFVVAVLSVLWLCRLLTSRIRIPQPDWVWAVPPYLIGSLACFWFIQRLATF